MSTGWHNPRRRQRASKENENKNGCPRWQMIMVGGGGRGGYFWRLGSGTMLLGERENAWSAQMQDLFSLKREERHLDLGGGIIFIVRFRMRFRNFDVSAIYCDWVLCWIVSVGFICHEICFSVELCFVSSNLVLQSMVEPSTTTRGERGATNTKWLCETGAHQKSKLSKVAFGEIKTSKKICFFNTELHSVCKRGFF